MLFVCSARIHSVAHSLNIGRSTVKEYQQRAKKAGIGWPEIESLTEEQIEQRLFPAKVLEGIRDGDSINNKNCRSTLPQISIKCFQSQGRSPV